MDIPASTACFAGIGRILSLLSFLSPILEGLYYVSVPLMYLGPFNYQMANKLFIFAVTLGVQLYPPPPKWTSGMRVYCDGMCGLVCHVLT